MQHHDVAERSKICDSICHLRQVCKRVGLRAPAGLAGLIVHLGAGVPATGSESFTIVTQQGFTLPTQHLSCRVPQTDLRYHTLTAGWMTSAHTIRTMLFACETGGRGMPNSSEMAHDDGP